MGLFLLQNHPPDLFERKHLANMYWFYFLCLPCSQRWSVDSAAPLRKRRSRQAGVFPVTAAPETNKRELSAEGILEACICRCRQLGLKEWTDLGRPKHKQDPCRTQGWAVTWVWPGRSTGGRRSSREKGHMGPSTSSNRRASGGLTRESALAQVQDDHHWAPAGS